MPKPISLYEVPQYYRDHLSLTSQAMVDNSHAMATEAAHKNYVLLMQSVFNMRLDRAKPFFLQAELDAEHEKCMSQAVR